MTKTKTRRLKLQKLSVLKKRADKVFSWYIRERDSHKCYTCGKQLTPQESQNGHFISRVYLATRFNEKNCHCQGSECNIFKKGNLAVYAIKLEEQYGQGILQELDKIKLNTVGNTREFYNQIIEKYEL